MKRHTITFLIVATIIFPLITFGQPSGYLGKRLLVGLQANTSYSYNHPNNFDLAGVRYFNKSEGIQYLFSFNLMKSITSEYVISKTVTFGASFMHWKTKYYFKYNPYNLAMPNNHTGDLTVKGFRFFMKQYYSPYAPIGNYVKMGLSLLKHDATLHVDNMQTSQYLQIDAPYSKTRLQFTFAFGKQSAVFNDRFIIDRGLELNYSGALAKEYYDSYFVSSLANHRAAKGLLLNFTLGLSFLP